MKTTIILLLGFALPTAGQIDDFLFRKTLAIEPGFVWPSDTRSASHITREDVMGLLGQIFPNPGEVVSDIQAFRFAPVDRREKNKLWLVVDADATGRGYFGDITAVYCQGRQCVWRNGSWDGGDSDLKDILVDADNDGVWEIVTRERAGFRGNADSLQMFRYFIRSVSETTLELVDHSDRYEEYFTRVLLPRIKQEQQEVLSGVPESRQRKALDYLAGKKEESSDQPAAEADRITDRLITAKAAMIMAVISYVNDDYRRRVLGEESAGVESAIRWAHSPDREIREFAIDVLQPIDHPRALSELKRLAASGDEATRERIGHVLELRQELRLDTKKVK